MNRSGIFSSGRIYLKRAALSFLTAAFLLSGCSSAEETNTDSAASSDTQNPQNGSETAESSGETSTDSEKEAMYGRALRIASVCAEASAEISADGNNSEDRYSLSAMQSVAARLGELGYSVSDTDNRINMENYGSVESFCEKAAAGETAETSFTLLMSTDSFVYYEAKADGGSLHMARCTVYTVNGTPEAGYYESFAAEDWKYTEKGYLLFDQYRMPGYDGPPGEIAVRVRPLDPACLEYNETYVRPVGYSLNAMLISDWSESDGYGQLNFYDLYDIMYRIEYGADPPYPYKFTGITYEIPAPEFESVLGTHLALDTGLLRSRTVYYADRDTYLYAPRGLNDAEYPYGPVPEVTACESLPDGTLRLTVEAVYAVELNDRAIVSELTVRPLNNGGFQYVSNRVTETYEGISGKWYTPRVELTG